VTSCVHYLTTIKRRKSSIGTYGTKAVSTNGRGRKRRVSSSAYGTKTVTTDGRGLKRLGELLVRKGLSGLGKSLDGLGELLLLIREKAGLLNELLDGLSNGLLY